MAIELEATQGGKERKTTFFLLANDLLASENAWFNFVSEKCNHTWIVNCCPMTKVPYYKIVDFVSKEIGTQRSNRRVPLKFLFRDSRTMPLRVRTGTLESALRPPL
jgi:hypothetical protein